MVVEADVREQQKKTSRRRFVEDIVPTRLSSMKLGDQAPRKQILKYDNKKKIIYQSRESAWHLYQKARQPFINFF